MLKMYVPLDISLTIIGYNVNHLKYISCRFFFLVAQPVDWQPYCIVTGFEHFFQLVQKWSVSQMLVTLSMC